MDEGAGADPAEQVPDDESKPVWSDILALALVVLAVASLSVGGFLISLRVGFIMTGVSLAGAALLIGWSGGD